MTEIALRMCQALRVRSVSVNVNRLALRAVALITLECSVSFLKELMQFRHNSKNVMVSTTTVMGLSMSEIQVATMHVQCLDNLVSVVRA